MRNMYIVYSHVLQKVARHLVSKTVKPLGADYVNTVIARWIRKSRTSEQHTHHKCCVAKDSGQ